MGTEIKKIEETFEQIKIKLEERIEEYIRLYENWQSKYNECNGKISSFEIEIDTLTNTKLKIGVDECKDRCLEGAKDQCDSKKAIYEKKKIETINIELNIKKTQYTKCEAE